MFAADRGDACRIRRADRHDRTSTARAARCCRRRAARRRVDDDGRARDARSGQSVAAARASASRRCCARPATRPTSPRAASRRSRSGLVAAIVPVLTNSLIAEIMQGLTDALAEHDFQLLLGVSGFSAPAEEALVRAVPVAPRRCDLSSPARTTRRRRSRHAASARGIPVVEGGNLTARADRHGRRLLERRCGARDHALPVVALRRPIGYIGAHPARQRPRPRSPRGLRRRPAQPRGARSTRASASRPRSTSMPGAAAMAQLAQRDAAAARGVLLGRCARRRRAVRVPAPRPRVPRRDRASPASTTSCSPPSRAGAHHIRVPRYEIGQRAGTLLCDRWRARRADDASSTSAIG